MSWDKKDFPRARGPFLSRIGETYGVYRKWYEVKYVLDFLYRKRILRTIRVFAGTSG